MSAESGVFPLFAARLLSEAVTNNDERYVGVKRPLIVVLDTDSAFLEMMQEFLEDEGYAVLCMLKNQNAFSTILECKPQLVIIELLFTDPEAGLGVLNKMRLHPETTHIPVVLASTTTQLLRDNEAHFRAKGCDILPKPFDLEELLTIMEKYVSLTMRDYVCRSE